MVFALIFLVKGAKLVENNLDIETITLFFDFWLVYAIIPVSAAAAIIGATVAVNVRPGPTLVSAIQHFAAGVVFAAAAGEILPDIMHRASPWATMIGGGIGVATMLLVKHLEALAKGPAGLLTVIGIDILIDGLVLGIGFAAGPKVGLLLTIALTIEVLFLGLTVATELGESVRSRARVVWITAWLRSVVTVVPSA